MRKHLPLAILLGILWLAGCSTDAQKAPEPVDEDPKTLIIYGNIEPYYTRNIEAAGKAVAAGTLIGGQRVLVYQEVSTGNVVSELVRDVKTAAGYRKVNLKTYGRGEITTMDPGDMRRVMDDMRALAPANHYGLALGVHASGWVPKEVGLLGRSAAPLELWEVRENPLTRYLGAGNYAYQKMNVSEFAAAMNGLEWDFILFDACFMACVESLYAMRGAAPYLIVSPAEILIEGFPYDRVVNLLFDDWHDLESVAHAYVSYYRGKNSHATISLVKTSELEALAAAVGDIVYNGANAVDPIAQGIQVFEGLQQHLFFDLDEYMRHLSTDVILYGRFADQLRRTVVYSDHTDNFFTAYTKSKVGVPVNDGQVVPINHYSGLTSFIPYAGNTAYLAAYGETEWYAAVN